MLVDRKVAACIGKDGGEGRTQTNRKTGKKGEQEIKLDINMVEHEEFNFSAGSQGKL